MQMNNKISILIVALFLALISFNAAWVSGGTTRAVAEDAIQNPGQPFTIFWYGTCTPGSNDQGLFAVTDTTSNATYYIMLCSRGATKGYSITSRNTTFYSSSYSTTLADDSIPDSLVMVAEDATNKKLYFNGTQVLNLTNNSPLSVNANDLCLNSQCRLTSPSQGAGTTNHAGYCGRALTADEIAEYYNNINDKDYIRQICWRVPGTELFLYEMKDMVVVRENTAGGVGGKYVHEYGYPIKDTGGTSQHLISIVVTGGSADSDSFFITGTFDNQS